MKRVLLAILAVIIIIVVILLLQRNQDTDDNTKNLQASIRFGWIPSASFAGEVAAMQIFDSKYNLELKCEAGGPGLNSIQLVQTGQNTFGTLAADEVLSAIDKGADFIIIGVINYYSPGGFVSLKSKNIKTPKDFEGKKVGLLPFGSTTLLYESMIKKNNVNKRKISEVTVSPDLKPFIEGRYDVHPVFVYDETVTLDKEKISYNLIEPKNFGVTFKGPVYFCKRETYEKNPELIKAFINAVADGWNFAIQNPDSAITMLKAFTPEIDFNREKSVLLKGILYFSAYKNQPINSDTESWNEMINELKEMKVINKSIDFKNVLKLHYINEYYKTE